MWFYARLAKKSTMYTKPWERLIISDMALWLLHDYIWPVQADNVCLRWPGQTRINTFCWWISMILLQYLPMNPWSLYGCSHIFICNDCNNIHYCFLELEPFLVIWSLILTTLLLCRLHLFRKPHSLNAALPLWPAILFLISSFTADCIMIQNRDL